MAEYIIPLAAFVSWMVAHFVKEALHIYKTGKFSLYTLLLETGGMPSSHSATVAGLTTGVWWVQGPSALFWITGVFSMIIMRDAFGVRKNVSDQAQILNLLSRQVKLERKVRIVLGHTPWEVLVGGLIGLVVGSGVCLYLL